jgi:hypothetical protein
MSMYNERGEPIRSLIDFPRIQTDGEGERGPNSQTPLSSSSSNETREIFFMEFEIDKHT